VETALVREVLEETRLRVTPGRLLYAFEVVSRVTFEDLNLVFLAELTDAGAGGLHPADTIDLSSTDQVLPPIADVIRGDLAEQWAMTPRWLGNIWDAARGRPSNP
jgi:8-oxo-dGTP pyrophosphatase MutT (NUDIX family)